MSCYGSDDDWEFDLQSMLEGDRPTGDMVAEYLRLFQKLRRSFLWSETSSDTLYDVITFLQGLVERDARLSDQRRRLVFQRYRLGKMKQLGRDVQQSMGQHVNDLGISVPLLGQVRAGVDKMLASLRDAETRITRAEQALEAQWKTLLPRMGTLVQENPPLKGQ